MQKFIIESIKKSIDLKSALLNDRQVLADIETVGTLIVNAFRQGRKVLLCGNGGSAADAQHIAAEFVGRFVTERQGLPAIALSTDTSILTAVGNDYGFDQIFRRQVQALGGRGDLLIAISTSGNSKNIQKALEQATSMGLTTIGLLGGTGGCCKALCNYAFVVDSCESARVQEIHITIGHILCGIVDKTIQQEPL